MSLLALLAVLAPWPAQAAQIPACEYPLTVQTVSFSAEKYPTIHQHYVDALNRGEPAILVIDRVGAADRRTRALKGTPTLSEYDRDEWPPAVLREGWHTDIAYVPSSENRSQGASLGAKIRAWCNGVRIKYEWT